MPTEGSSITIIHQRSIYLHNYILFLTNKALFPGLVIQIQIKVKSLRFFPSPSSPGTGINPHDLAL
jgi:hypothetical protein